MHTCHAIDCTVPVPPKLFMCKSHWFKLSKPLRDAVNATYRPGQEIDKLPSPAYTMAAQTAIHWLHVRENKPGKLCSVCMAAKKGDEWWQNRTKWPVEQSSSPVMPDPSA